MSGRLWVQFPAESYHYKNGTRYSFAWCSDSIKKIEYLVGLRTGCPSVSIM